MDGVLERIQELCKANNLTVKSLEIELGFSNGTVGKWKNAQDVPYGKINAVAKILNTTPDYLLYGKFNVHKNELDAKYYYDDITAKLAQELRDNPEMNMFMSSTRKLTPEQFNVIKETIRQFLKEDGVIDDE